MTRNYDRLLSRPASWMVAGVLVLITGPCAAFLLFSNVFSGDIRLPSEGFVEEHVLAPIISAWMAYSLVLAPPLGIVLIAIGLWKAGWVMYKKVRGV